MGAGHRVLKGPSDSLSRLHGTGRVPQWLPSAWGAGPPSQSCPRGSLSPRQVWVCLPMGFSCGQGKFLCRCCLRGRLAMLAASRAIELHRHGACICIEDSYCKGRAVHLPRGPTGPCEVAATTAALSPGHTSIQKLNVALDSLSLSMWGHCFHSLCYLFPCTRPEIHALFHKSSLLNLSLVLYSGKLTHMIRAWPTLYFSSYSWTFLLTWHETKDLFLYQGRGNCSFPVLPNRIL